MTCMAGLPDGTYLILNGGQHGVAGFGLGDNPNYNAVLYDPSKPVNQRMSVMANTTVAVSEFVLVGPWDIRIYFTRLKKSWLTFSSACTTLKLLYS
jgi:hypothetical protein